MIVIEILGILLAGTLAAVFITRKTLTQALFVKLTFDLMALIAYFTQKRDTQLVLLNLALLLIFLGTGLSVLLLNQMARKQGDGNQ